MEFDHEGLNIRITDKENGGSYIQIFDDDGHRINNTSILDGSKSKEMATKMAIHAARYIASLNPELPSKLKAPIVSLCLHQDSEVGREIVQIANKLSIDNFWIKAIEAVESDLLNSFVKELLLKSYVKGGAIRPETLNQKLKRRQQLVKKLNNLSTYLGTHSEFNEIRISTLVRLCSKNSDLNTRELLSQALFDPKFPETPLQQVLELLVAKLSADLNQLGLDDGERVYRASSPTTGPAISDVTEGLPLFWGDNSHYMGQAGSKDTPAKHNLAIRVLCDHFTQYTGLPKIGLVAQVMCVLEPKWYTNDSQNKWAEHAQEHWKNYKKINI